MFLELLNRKEKENFLELAYYVAQCDSNFVQEEQDWIRVYREEMKLNDYKLKGKNLDEVIDELNGSSFLSKTSIFLEILDLILADLDYNGDEQRVVAKIREKWNINDEQFDSIVFWLKDKHIIKTVEQAKKSD